MSKVEKFSGSELRALRQDAKFTQEELGRMIGISRETVNAIENERPGAINSIEAKVIKKWWASCRSKASAQTKESFVDFAMNYFGFGSRV